MVSYKDYEIVIGLEIHAESSAGRYTDGAIKTYPRLHEHIQHARREHASHGAAFQYQPRFHRAKSSIYRQRWQVILLYAQKRRI